MKKYTWFFVLLGVMVFNMIYWQLLSVWAAMRPEGVSRGDASIVGAIYLVAVCLFVNQRGEP